MYVIEKVKGTRVVKRRKATDKEPVTMRAATREDELKPKRVVKRRVQKAAPPPPPPVKAVAAKPVAAKPKAKPAASRESYKSGQNGPLIELDVVDLNDKERKLLNALNGEGRGERPELTIAEMASVAFPREPKAKGNSWVRNSLRRVVRAGYAEKCQRGRYRVTDTGRRRLAKAA